MSSETLDTRIKGDIKETPEKKLLPVRPKTLRRRKKRKTLAITKRYALKRKRKKRNIYPPPPLPILQDITESHTNCT